MNGDEAWALRTLEFAIAQSQTSNEAVAALRDEHADDERWIHEAVVLGLVDYEEIKNAIEGQL